MTILLAFRPDRGARSAASLAARLARSAGEPIVAVTVVPHTWSTPSMARIDGEYGQWATQHGEGAAREALRVLAELAPGIEAEAVWVGGRSASSALVQAAETYRADLLVLGSAAGGGLGQIVVGSTAERLLHSSPVAVAVAPRGYRTTADARVGRVTCAFSGTPESVDVLALTASITRRVGAGLRIATFGVRGRTMYPPRSASTQRTRCWRSGSISRRARRPTPWPYWAAAATCRRRPQRWSPPGGAGPRLDEIDWRDDEVLVIGSSSVGALARVFVGSGAAKMLRHSPVPVVAIPAAVAAEAAGDLGTRKLRPGRAEPGADRMAGPPGASCDRATGPPGAGKTRDADRPRTGIRGGACRLVQRWCGDYLPDTTVTASWAVTPGCRVTDTGCEPTVLM